jgi:hypothetical protein
MSGSSSSAAAPASLADQSQWYEKLLRFYEHYAPDKVPTAAITLRAYEGREEHMFRALEKKYGPLSAVPPSHGVLPRHVPSAATADTGAPGPHSETRSVHKRSVVAPTTTTSLGSLAVAVNPPAVPEVMPLHFDVYRVRLERFYAQYAPEKLGMVETALEAYAGREEAMFRLLEKKYGPEPTAFVVVSPVADRNAADDDVDDDEEQEDVGTPSARARGRQRSGELVTPQSLRDPVPYDYFEALITAGFVESAVEDVLMSFGSGKEHYAAAISIILTIVGHDALFDANTELTFPVSKLKHVKKCDPDILDEIAFEHVCTYKKVFVAAMEHAAHLRHMEAMERSAILKELKLGAGLLSYRMVVLAEALKYIGPIEEERRGVVTDDERLRREGLILWFRQRRQDIVNTIGRRHGRLHLGSAEDSDSDPEDPYWASGGPEGHLDSLEQRFKDLCTRQKAKSDAIREKWCARANFNMRTESRSPQVAIRSASPQLHSHHADPEQHSPDGHRPCWIPNGPGAYRSVSLRSGGSASGKQHHVPSTSPSQSAEIIREARAVIGEDTSRSCSAAAAGARQHAGARLREGEKFNLFVSVRAKTVAKRGAFSRIGFQ